MDAAVLPPCSPEDQEADNCHERFDRAIPEVWEELTVDDRAYVERFLCDRTVFYYREYEADDEDVLGADGFTT